MPTKTVRYCLLKRDRGSYHRAPKDQCCPRVELQHFPIKTFSEKDGGNHRPTDTGCKRTKRQANVWHQQVHVSGSNGKIILYSDLNACQVHPAPLRPLLRREAAQQVHGGQGKVGGAGELSSRERWGERFPKVRIVRAEEQEVMVAWREHKAALAAERRGRRWWCWLHCCIVIQPLCRSAVVTCFLESLLFTALIIPLPLAIIATELLFHYGTRLIPPDRLEKLWWPNATMEWNLPFFAFLPSMWRVVREKIFCF